MSLLSFSTSIDCQSPSELCFILKCADDSVFRLIKVSHDQTVNDADFTRTQSGQVVDQVEVRTIINIRLNFNLNLDKRGLQCIHHLSKPSPCHVDKACGTFNVFSKSKIALVLRFSFILVGLKYQH